MQRGHEKAIWEAVLLPGVQGIEATLVARFYWSRCTESSAIARRSFVWRQQDPLAAASVALVLKQI
jgi:hypothetical protein